MIWFINNADGNVNYASGNKNLFISIKMYINVL